MKLLSAEARKATGGGDLLSSEPIGAEDIRCVDTTRLGRPRAFDALATTSPAHADIAQRGVQGVTVQLVERPARLGQLGRQSRGARGVVP